MTEELGEQDIVRSEQEIADRRSRLREVIDHQIRILVNRVQEVDELIKQGDEERKRLGKPKRRTRYDILSSREIFRRLIDVLTNLNNDLLMEYGWRWYEHVDLKEAKRRTTKRKKRK